MHIGQVPIDSLAANGTPRTVFDVLVVPRPKTFAQPVLETGGAEDMATLEDVVLFVFAGVVAVGIVSDGLSLQARDDQLGYAADIADD